ncbi:MAG: DoxX family protein [Planctomycetes bacterium]|nr:DoxX family protein [Planctomycetota bacterium]
MVLDAIRKTCGCRHMIVPRLLAGLPLTAFGVMHLTGAMPMRPLLEAAGIPAPGLMAIVAPLAQLVAGLLLLSGAFARIGGMLAAGAMVGAIMTHVKIPNDQWPVPTTDATQGPWPEPTFMMYLAILIALCSVYVLVRGGGAWSIDIRSRKGMAGSAGGSPSAETSGG